MGSLTDSEIKPQGQLSGCGWYRFVVVALLAVFAFLSGSAVSRKSPTYDETSYIGAGAYLLKTHRFDDEIVLRHPVFWTVLHDLPLVTLTRIPDEVWQEQNGILRGQKIIGLRKDDLLLNACRFMLLPFGLILGTIIFCWSRTLHGDLGGLLSLTVFCLCPNFLAHSPLITPDVMLSCFTVLTAWRLWRLAKMPRLRNLFFAGGSFGLMLLSKHTGLLVGLFLLFADATYRTANGQIDWRSIGRVGTGLRHTLLVIVTGFMVLWAVYGFNLSWIDWSSGRHILVPAGPYFRGAVYQYLESRQPHSFFLMGMLSTWGWWYYFIVVCLIKIPVATLILIAGLLFGRRALGLRFHSDEFYLWLPFALLGVYLSCFNTIQNGFRYLLPVYALVLVAIGKYGAILSRRSALALGVGFLVLWASLSSILAWPNYISYSNELIGGNRQGYHWLGDSNIDWGQDLKELKYFMDARGIHRVQLSYFGTADPDHYGIDYEYLPSGDSPLPRTLPLPDGEVSSRFLAISSYYYQGIGLTDENERTFYRSLYKYTPSNLVGGSILIFDTGAARLRRQRPMPLVIRQLLGLERRDAPVDLYP